MKLLLLLLMTSKWENAFNVWSTYSSLFTFSIQFQDKLTWMPNWCPGIDRKLNVNLYAIILHLGICKEMFGRLLLINIQTRIHACQSLLIRYVSDQMPHTKLGINWCKYTANTHTHTMRRNLQKKWEKHNYK